jgi:predicted Rossmann fold nucleotide-binding protein DprA/Smf involved in DNA uptake
VDQLAARAGLDVPMTLAVLVQLELGGVVEQMPGLLFRAA